MADESKNTETESIPLGMRVAFDIRTRPRIKRMAAVQKRKDLSTEISNMKQFFKGVPQDITQLTTTDQKLDYVLQSLYKLGLSLANIENLLVDTFGEPYKAAESDD